MLPRELPARLSVLTDLDTVRAARGCNAESEFGRATPRRPDGSRLVSTRFAAPVGTVVVGGTLDFIRRVKAGDFGLVAIDGPRGPCSVVKPEPLHMVAKARAQIILLTTSASHGITFGTWDRAHLPLPFARVELSFRLLPPLHSARRICRAGCPGGAVE